MKLTLIDALGKLWPFFTAIVAAIVYVIISLSNKAESKTVEKHEQDILLLKKEAQSKQEEWKWLKDTIFDIANEVGVNPEPPP